MNKILSFKKFKGFFAFFSHFYFSYMHAPSSFKFLSDFYYSIYIMKKNVLQKFWNSVSKFFQSNLKKKSSKFKYIFTVKIKENIAR